MIKNNLLAHFFVAKHTELTKETNMDELLINVQPSPEMVAQVIEALQAAGANCDYFEMIIKSPRTVGAFVEKIKQRLPQTEFALATAPETDTAGLQVVDKPVSVEPLQIFTPFFQGIRIEPSRTVSYPVLLESVHSDLRQYTVPGLLHAEAMRRREDLIPHYLVDRKLIFLEKWCTVGNDAIPGSGSQSPRPQFVFCLVNIGCHWLLEKHYLAMEFGENCVIVCFKQ